MNKKLRTINKKKNNQEKKHDGRQVSDWQVLETGNRGERGKEGREEVWVGGRECAVW